MWYVFRTGPQWLAAVQGDSEAGKEAAAMLFQSGWFIEGLLSQTLIVHMIRTEKIPFLQSTAALPMVVLTGAIMALGVYLPFSPFAEFLGLQPLPWQYFPWLVGILLAYSGLTQLAKAWYIRRFKAWL